MKRLLMLMSVAAVVATTAPAYADPASDKDDADFLKELKDAGLTYSDPGSAIAAAKNVCDLVDKGTAANDIVQNLQQRNPGFSGDNATRFTLLAANSYCPRYIVGDAPSSGAPSPDSKPPGS
jgi:Protein of unknown function (DUF732)